MTGHQCSSTGREELRQVCQFLDSARLHLVSNQTISADLDIARALAALRSPAVAAKAHDTIYLRGWNEGIERAIELLEEHGWWSPTETVRTLLEAPPSVAQAAPNLFAISDHVPLGFECRSCGGSAYNWLTKIGRFQKSGETCCADFKDWVEKASSVPSTHRDFPAGATGVGLGGGIQREQNPSKCATCGGLRRIPHKSGGYGIDCPTCAHSSTQSEGGK